MDSTGAFCRNGSKCSKRHLCKASTSRIHQAWLGPSILRIFLHFVICEDFCCSGSHQRRVCAAFLLRHKPNSPTMPNDQFCACEENPDLKQHENERGAKLSVHSAETGLALTFTGRAALLETIPEARHASTLGLSFDSSFQLHEQAATETEAGTFLHSVL